MKTAQFIAAAVTAALLGMAGVSIAGAASGPSAQAQKPLKVAADTIGVTPRELRQQLRAGKSIADIATAHHVEPQTVINALVNADKGRITMRVNERGVLGRGARRAGVKVAAETIGVTPRELRQQLRAGKSIADVASEHSVNPQSVVTALVDAATKRIDAAQAAGKIAGARAATLEAKLENRITKLVNRHFGMHTGG
jgi:uncharacterized protein (DUF433 family)